MKGTRVIINKVVSLGLSILEISKILICKFWYDYIKPKYGEKETLYYMDTNSFIVYIKTEDIYSDIAKNVETRFQTSNYELDRPLPNEKNKKVIGLMKDGFDGKTFSYITGNNNEDEKAKGKKKLCCKKKLKFQDYKQCLEVNQLENKINNLEKK